MLFCTNCKQIILYNSGYCPNCGILFRQPAELSEVDRMMAEETARRFQARSDPEYNPMNIPQGAGPAEGSSELSDWGDDGGYPMTIHPGRRRLPRGLVSSIICLIGVIIVSALIYLLTA